MMETVNVYQYLIKRNDIYTVITFQAENEIEAKTYAVSKGEVIQKLSVTTVDSETSIDYNEQMLDYYPEVIKAIREFQALIETQSLEVEEMHQELIKILGDAYLGTAGEDVISKWEQFLGIVPQPLDSYSSESAWLDDRRATILARLYKTEKINTESIANIVKIFTGADSAAVSYFKDGVIYILITPPKNNREYKFENVEQELRKKIPAHLMFQVDRNYYTWLHTKTTYATWDDVLHPTTTNPTATQTWEDLLLSIPFQTLMMNTR